MALPSMQASQRLAAKQRLAPTDSEAYANSDNGIASDVRTNPNIY